MKLLYIPFEIMANFIASRLGRSIYRNLWAKLDHEPPPVPGAGTASLTKTVGAQALKGAVMAATTAAVDGAMAQIFHHLLGGWPKKPPKKDEE